MDEGQREIEDLMRTRGFEEKEARAYYHLNEAEQLFKEIVQSADPPYSKASYAMWTFPHFIALRNQAGRWVLERNYPEGWGSAPDPEEGEE